MKVIASFYTLLMLSTFICVPYQLPVPKVSGEFDVGYHLTCWFHESEGLGCRKPYMQAADSNFVTSLLSKVGLENISQKEIPVKYRVNYVKLVAEWLFITFMTLIWMLAIHFSNRTNKKLKECPYGAGIYGGEPPSAP